MRGTSATSRRFRARPPDRQPHGKSCDWRAIGWLGDGRWRLRYLRSGMAARSRGPRRSGPRAPLTAADLAPGASPDRPPPPKQDEVKDELIVLILLEALLT